MKTYNGTLYYVIGDIPATQILGGFKEGVSVTKNHAEHAILQLMNWVTTYQIKQLHFKNEVEYMDHDRCDALDHLEGISKMTRKFWSKEYGITRRSVIASILQSAFCLTLCMFCLRE